MNITNWINHETFFHSLELTILIMIVACIGACSIKIIKTFVRYYTSTLYEKKQQELVDEYYDEIEINLADTLKMMHDMSDMYPLLRDEEIFNTFKDVSMRYIDEITRRVIDAVGMDSAFDPIEEDMLNPSVVITTAVSIAYTEIVEKARHMNVDTEKECVNSCNKKEVVMNDSKN